VMAFFVNFSLSGISVVAISLILKIVRQNVPNFYETQLCEFC